MPITACDSVDCTARVAVSVTVCSQRRAAVQVAPMHQSALTSLDSDSPSIIATPESEYVE